MRRPFTRKDCAINGITLAQQRWKFERGEWQRVHNGVYLVGGEPPTPAEQALATLVVTRGTAGHSLAGLLYDLDSVTLSEPYVSVAKCPRRMLPGLVVRHVEAVLIRGYACTTGLQTIVDLASVMDDVTWEHALENALRDKLTSIPEIEMHLQGRRVRGAGRIRRVLALRPTDAPATDSLLETLMVQLIRRSQDLPEPKRQVKIFNKHGDFVARVDLAWPELGVFIELDGMGFHKQPVYDARRETGVVAATGWLPARFTWREVRYLQPQSLRRLEEIVQIAIPR